MKDEQTDRGLAGVNTDRAMVETEREILREKDEETKLGERTPFESARQATYEDSVAPVDEWEYEDS
jgi:hypothetical protein